MLIKLYIALRRRHKLFRISKQLNYPRYNRIKRNETIEDLIKFCRQDPIIELLLLQYNANDDTLKALFSALNLGGAGEMRKGFLISARAISEPLPLTFLLGHFDGKDFQIKNFDRYNSMLYICYKLTEYYQTGNRELLMNDR